MSLKGRAHAGGALKGQQAAEQVTEITSRANGSRVHSALRGSKTERKKNK